MPRMPIAASDDEAIRATNQSISSANPTPSSTDSLNDSRIRFEDGLSGSDYHSCSSDDPLDSSANHPTSCNNPGSSSDTMSSSARDIHDSRSSEAPLNIIRPKALLINVSSAVPFKWEEVPGKPIPTCELKLLRSISDKIPMNASPLQLPPKLQPQAPHHNLLLQSPCRLEACVQAIHPSPHKLPPICPSPPPILQPSSHLNPPRLHPVYHSCPPSPYLLQQKLKKVCKSLVLRSASWSQPLHKLTPPWSSFACRHGSPVDDEEETITNYDRFFFDIACPKDLKYTSSMDLWKPTLPTYEECQREFPTLPIFDTSQTEDEFVSRDVLSFLDMEAHEAASPASSPQQTILLHERQGSGLYSWPPASIINLHERVDDVDDDEGFHDFFSSTSSLEVVAQRVDGEYSESACSSPLPWFLDFSPQEEENHQVVNRASNKMSLVKLVAVTRLKSMISKKLCKLKRRRAAGAYQQEKCMWSPTLATYLYSTLQSKELKESTAALSYQSEDEQSSPDEGHLRINYHLPSTIKGQLISNDYLSDDELVSPANQAAASCPSFSDKKKQPRNATHRLSLREHLAEFNSEYLCPVHSKQSKGSPHSALERRDPVHTCKGICKFRKAVQVLVNSIIRPM